MPDRPRLRPATRGGGPAACSDLRRFTQGLERAWTWCRGGFWSPSLVNIEGQLEV